MFKMSVKNCTSKEKKYVPRPPQKNKGSVGESIAGNLMLTTELKT